MEVKRLMLSPHRCFAAEGPSQGYILLWVPRCEFRRFNYLVKFCRELVLCALHDTRMHMFIFLRETRSAYSAGYLTPVSTCSGKLEPKEHPTLLFAENLPSYLHIRIYTSFEGLSKKIIIHVILFRVCMNYPEVQYNSKVGES